MGCGTRTFRNFLPLQLRSEMQHDADAALQSIARAQARVGDTRRGGKQRGIAVINLGVADVQSEIDFRRESVFHSAAQIQCEIGLLRQARGKCAAAEMREAGTDFDKAAPAADFLAKFQAEEGLRFAEISGGAGRKEIDFAFKRNKRQPDVIAAAESRDRLQTVP